MSTPIPRSDRAPCVQLYGSDFKSSHWFGRWHLGAHTFNSPYHGQPSFFPSHSYLGHMFERSLQSVDKSLALHYWDYTIDAELYNNDPGESSPRAEALSATSQCVL